MQAAKISQLCNVDMPKNCSPLSNRVFKVTFMCKRHHIVHQHHNNLKFTGLQVLLGSKCTIFSPFPTGSAGLSQDDKQPFFLTFVKGNISRCAGCGLKDLRQIDGRPYR